MTADEIIFGVTLIEQTLEKIGAGSSDVYQGFLFKHGLDCQTTEENGGSARALITKLVPGRFPDVDSLVQELSLAE